VRIGDASVTSIGGYAAWTNVSDGRIKTNVKENVPGLSFIMQLQPVTYNLNISAINQKLNVADSSVNQNAINQKSQIVYTGFIAQQVEQAAQNVSYDFSGVDKPENADELYGLRYAEFVVPMVKAIQEQQTMIETQQKEIELLKQEIELLKQK
jgi:hypothetical protein